MRITAEQFYNKIKNKSKYKLVNGLFIVEYIGNGTYKYVGGFYKKGRYSSAKHLSYVKIGASNQLFNPSRKLTRGSFHLMKVYREMKNKDDSIRLSDAMKVAKKSYKGGNR